jgi:hypothetical protein
MAQTGKPPAPSGRDAGALLAEAKASFARRPDAAAVKRAEQLFLEAARADPTGVDALAGAIQAKIWLVEHEPDATSRTALAVSAVDAGQSCLQRAPASAVCDYGLALALGIQAREKRTTVREGLKLMVEHLRRAQVEDPSLDLAGPSRVLAIVLVRAPQWPLGPGNPEAGLVEARRAVALAPEHPPNHLALAEALAATGRHQEARAEAERGVALARARASAGDADAAEWLRDGEKLLARRDRSSAGAPPGG